MPHLPYLPPDDEYGSALHDDYYDGLTRPGTLPVSSPTGGPAGGYGTTHAPANPTLPHSLPPVESRPYSGSYAPPPYMPYDPHSAHRRRVRSIRRRRNEWAWIVVAAALFGVTIVISLGMFTILRGSREAATNAGGEMVAARATAIVIVPTAVPGLELAGAVAAEPTADPALGQFTLQPWDGQERFTILVMGWDRRPEDPPDAAYRTDTMMLVSLDPVTHSMGILSIPRDLYVNIPGYNQLQRVNSAYVLGELRQPGYGHQLAMETVMNNLGIRVHDYLIVDFSAFIALIDAIGGIDVDVPYTINDTQYPDMYYGYDPFYISAGPHHLDGATALKYARTRHTGNDFRRAERQQQILFAVRDRILNFSNLPQLLISAPTIWASVQQGVRTGLNFDQIMRLAWYAKDIPGENIHTGVIDEGYISFYTTPSGASVVIPNRYALGSLMVEVFGQNYSQ